MLSRHCLQATAHKISRYSTTAAAMADSVSGLVNTRVVPVEGSQLGHFAEKEGVRSIDLWELPESSSKGLQILRSAAHLIRESSVPVAFPTETVYGLGADATRSKAVKGIYKAKGRPSDNPLIIHVCDLSMLRDILLPERTNGHACADPIPDIYKSLLARFWPGPLTILLRNPENSILAREVTAGLDNFGVRMPNSSLALSLIKLAAVPIAAPSANASTKPSTTTADHVLHDLDGRIELILDGGSCEVGVESTIVDGLCTPPVILRPGGISINSIRECPGWENVKIAYKDELETNGAAPRAPGMKYKHYSPKAKTILAEGSSNVIPKDVVDFTLEIGSTAEESLLSYSGLPYQQNQNGSIRFPVIGVVRTRHWVPWGGFNESSWSHVKPYSSCLISKDSEITDLNGKHVITVNAHEGYLYTNSATANEPPVLLAKIIEIALGSDTKTIAHGLFSALRELDNQAADLIYVEGIEDDGVDLRQNGGDETHAENGDIAAAIMNRLRKAATIIRS